MPTGLFDKCAVFGLSRRMPHLVQISDLHFGAEYERRADVLLETIRVLDPELVVVSGDLTQHARRSEMEEARKFLDRLQRRYLVIPGNHDLPAWEWRRFVDQFKLYRELISEEAYPCYFGEAFAVVGVWTPRVVHAQMDWSNGRISPRQWRRVAELFEQANPEAVRMVTAHHPFTFLETEARDEVGRARQALNHFAGTGVSATLSGHFHAAYWRQDETGIWMINASTAISHRLTSQPNSFNALTIVGGAIELEVHTWDGECFAVDRRATLPVRSRLANKSEV